MNKMAGLFMSQSDLFSNDSKVIMPFSVAEDGVKIEALPFKRTPVYKKPILKKSNTTLSRLDGVDVTVKGQLSFDMPYQEKRTIQNVDVYEGKTKKGDKILSVASIDGVVLSVPGCFEKKDPTPPKLEKVKSVYLTEELPTIQAEKRNLSAPISITETKKSNLLTTLQKSAKPPVS